MLKKNLTALALTSLTAIATSVSVAQTVTQNFSGDPLTNGWAVFGDTSAFTWDSTNQNLKVTWDSARTNCYFHHPLGITLTRYEDFRIEFDLQLEDFMSGNELDKTGPLPVSIGLLNLASATSPTFNRGNFGLSPNVAAFEFLPFGYYIFGGDRFDSLATTVADFVSESGFSIAPIIFKPHFEFEFPSNQLVHVQMIYTAANQSLDLSLATSNVVFYHPPLVLLNSTTNSLFSNADDYSVDTFSISSFSSYGDPYNSLLAHGTVDNISVIIPPIPPVRNVAAVGVSSTNVWQTSVRTLTNWNYTLERKMDLAGWTNVSASVNGNGTVLFLQDTNPPGDKAFYRVRATQP